MEIKQIYELVNAVTTETLGEHAVLTEDLSNVVDIGKEIFNANSVDRYVRSLVDHIGKVIFVNRPYTGTAPSVLRDGWEYGAVCEKIMAQMPKATENESWELEDGVSYDPNIFYKPEVSAKFFNKRTTWEIPLSFTEMQVRGSFSSASQMNGFLSMLHTSVENSKSIKTSDMIMRTINSMIAATFYNLSSGGTYTGTSGIRCVNLLYLYNQANTGHEIYDTATAIKTPEFIRFAAYIMGLYKDRLKKMSTLFNIGGQPRFTSSDRMHLILLSEFEKAAEVYLQSDVYHNSLVKLPEAEVVPFWQGSGTDYALTSTSKIQVTVPTGVGEATTTVTASGILGVMFDREALGVCNERQRVTTNYNPKAEFFTNWYKVDTGYWNDWNENFVVFYAADASAA